MRITVLFTSLLMVSAFPFINACSRSNLNSNQNSSNQAHVLASTSSANIYIAQTAAGSDNGSNCSNAYTYTFFNNSSNWGAGASQIGPGTMVHLCGTFSGTPGEQLLSFQGSGSSGNPITLFFESGANLTAPYWSSSGAIRDSGYSWIVIDGGSNGIIQNTKNGTGLAYQEPSGAVSINGPLSNVIVRNLTIANICQHTSSSDLTGCIQGGNGDGGISVGGGSTNVTVTENIIHDTSTGIFYSASSGDSGIVFSNNTISRTNWAIGSDGGNSSGSGSFTITGNDISCVVGGTCNWDDANDGAFHHNGVMIFPQGGSKMYGVVIANNYFHDINGHTTGFIFLDPDAGSGADVPGVHIYNNVGFTTAGQGGPSNDMWEPGAGVTEAIIVNNTAAGPTSTAFGVWTNGRAENNIISNTGDVAISYYQTITGVISNYNDIYGANPNQLFCVFYNGSSVSGGGSCGVIMSLSAWTAATTSICASSGCDVNSIMTNPNLTSTFRLNSGSPAIKAGINLTSLGISGLNVSAPQTFGVGGSCGTGCVPRPSSGPWDMGAYQFASSGSQPTPAPTPVSTPNPTPASTPPPTSGSSSNYMGCYTDSSTRALPNALTFSGTIESCVAAAKAQNLTYAGLQYGGECRAGNTLGFTKVADSNCNMRCSGNANEICGGNWLNSVYSTSGSGSGSATTSAQFVKVDSSTQGSWIGNYGASGYALFQYSQSLPSYVSMSVTGQSNWVWNPATSDVRALQESSSSTRIAASDYAVTSFTIDINLTDGQSHQVALYVIDWDGQGRTETLTVTDATSGSVLNSQSVSSFTSGKYVVWNIQGHVKIQVTTNAGPNGVVSGVFIK